MHVSLITALFQILTDCNENHSRETTKSTKSMLESLPTDILLVIIGELSGHNQIMAALACKTLAAVVEASTIRKIANIIPYKVGSKDPSAAVWKRGLPWTSYYGKPTLPDALEWREWGFTDDTFPSTYAATDAQVTNLKPAIQKWLGPKYRFCTLCHKFRTLQRPFWRAFAEYENPGITKKSSKTGAKKIKELIDLWNDTPKEASDTSKEANDTSKVASWLDTTWPPAVCPAHDLLKERRGQRVIKAA